MEGNSAPGQPTGPNFEQTKAIAAQHIRKEVPTPPSSINSNLENRPAPNSNPQFNEYGEIQEINTPPQIEARTTTPEIQNKGGDYASSREDFNSKLAGAAALADAMAALGDKAGAKQILDATLEGKLANLDSPPDMKELQRLANKAEWDKLPVIKKIAIALGSK